MKGYVRNKSASWRHAMKRSVGPGHKIPLEELYEQYGTKHDLEEGTAFIEWLRQIKLKDNAVWEIVLKGEKPEKKVEAAKESVKEVDPADIVVPLVKKEREISDITGMSVRVARAELKKITNLKLLKYAFSEANQMANKDTLCILLRRRIQELELTRR